MTMTLADREGHIWFDGEIVPWKEARVHVLTIRFITVSESLRESGISYRERPGYIQASRPY